MTTENSATYNYLEHVTEFITFLSTKDLTLDEILSHLVQVVLSPLNIEGVALRQLNNENQSIRIGSWGIPFELLQVNGPVYNLNDKYPSTDTLRYRRTTWINTLPDFGDEYPLLKATPYTTGAKSFICFPIDRAGTPVASLSIYSRDLIQPSAEIEAFLKAVGSVFSMYMIRQDSNLHELQGAGKMPTPSDPGSTDAYLTERQEMILRLISEDRTNLSISELLGYSESTIRQETIRIFAKLDCTSRQEAALIYWEQLAKSTEKKV